jgi:hypothetical protein
MRLGKFSGAHGLDVGWNAIWVVVVVEHLRVVCALRIGEIFAAFFTA